MKAIDWARENGVEIEYDPVDGKYLIITVKRGEETNTLRIGPYRDPNAHEDYEAFLYWDILDRLQYHSESELLNDVRPDLKSDEEDGQLRQWTWDFLHFLDPIVARDFSWGEADEV